MRQALQLGVISASNLGLLFIFQWYVFTSLGPGVSTDALFAGMTIPQLVLGVISFSLMHVLVPLLAGESEERIRHDSWAFFTLIGMMFGLLALTLALLAKWWVPLTVPGFNAEGRLLTVELTRIQLIGMVFTAVNGVQWAAYHARQRFVWAELTSLIVTASSLPVLMLLLPIFGVTAAAWILVLRSAFQTLLLFPGMGKPLRPDLKSAAIKQTWARVKPLLLGTAYYKTDPIVDRYLLSTAGSGSLSLYYLAQQLFGVVNQVFNKAIVAPLVPMLSRLYKNHDIRGFRRLYLGKLLQMGGICMAGYLILAITGRQLLKVLIGHGSVSAANVHDLWIIMIWLGGAFIGGAMGQITSSTFYACGNTTTPVRMSIVTFTLYIPCKLVAFHFHGIEGLALTTSIYYLVNLGLQAYLLKKKHLSQSVDLCRT